MQDAGKRAWQQMQRNLSLTASHYLTYRKAPNHPRQTQFPISGLPVRRTSRHHPGPGKDSVPNSSSASSLNNQQSDLVLISACSYFVRTYCTRRAASGDGHEAPQAERSNVYRGCQQEKQFRVGRK